MVDNDTSVAPSTNFAFRSKTRSLQHRRTTPARRPPRSPLITGSSCTGAVNYSVSCATPSPAGAYPNPGCAGFVDGATGDVWFTANSVSSNPIRYPYNPGSTGTSATDLGMAVYTGNCAGMTLVSCDDNSAGSNMPALTIVPPVPARPTTCVYGPTPAAARYFPHLRDFRLYAYQRPLLRCHSACTGCERDLSDQRMCIGRRCERRHRSDLLGCRLAEHRMVHRSRIQHQHQDPYASPLAFRLPDRRLLRCLRRPHPDRL